MKTAFSTLALSIVILASSAAASAADTNRAPAAAKAAQRTAVAGAPEVRMSKLIGKEVRNPRGQALGHVKDVILDTNSGRVHYAVLSFGGFLGVRDKLFAMPLAKVGVDDNGRLVLDATKEQLESAPAFDSTRWPDWRAGAYRAQLDRAYGNETAAADARFRRASELLKAQVRDANGADIGDIRDIVVDIPKSRVDYVVVEFDRAWNPNDKLVALPMSALASVATARPPAANADSAAPPRNPPGVLSLETPSGPTKGTASAVNPPGAVETRPPPIDPQADVARIEKPPLETTTSYADDEDLVYRGTREQLRDAPTFDTKRYPKLGDAGRRQ
jgi:sporulation protein YlmC with PRC-barrel domain